MDTQDPQSGAPAAPVFVQGFCSEAARPFVLVATILASAMGFIDGTVVSIALPAIRESTGASLRDAQWISNAYMLTLSALILVGGAFGDRFGLTRVFSLGIVLFVTSSLVCALAPTAQTLIIARFVQGSGAALMVPGSLSIISRAYPSHIRGKAIGIWAAASAVTSALGPIIGGLALTFGGAEMWRWIFAVNLPLGVLALYLVNRYTQKEVEAPDTRIDLWGASLATLGLGVLAFALTRSEEHGFMTPTTLSLVALSAASLATFLYVEHRSSHPMLPLGLFQNRVFATANLATFLLYFTLSVNFFFLPMTIISGWGISEIIAAAAYAPLSIFVGGLSTHIGAWSDRIGPGPMIGIGALIVCVAYAALALTFPVMNFWGRVFPCMCLMGLGMAFVVSPLSTAVMTSVGDRNTGIASGVNNAISRMSGLIAVAATGSVVAVFYARTGGTVSFGIPSQTPGHVDAMNSAFAGVAWICAALALTSAVIAFWGINQKPEDRVV